MTGFVAGLIELQSHEWFFLAIVGAQMLPAASGLINE